MVRAKMMSQVLIEPIGVFHSRREHRYDAPRQTDSTQVDDSYIDFFPGRQFEQALEGVEEFERLWILFQFHLNQHWKPMVLPPRGSTKKRGVFSTRAPYRPNPIGLSCVKTLKREGLRLWVESADLIDGTPVFDIKPYLPYADAFPEAKQGWIAGVENKKFELEWTPLAKAQCQWLEYNGVLNIFSFTQQQLEFDPFDNRRKRVVLTLNTDDAKEGILSYRTWRLHFHVTAKKITLQKITSGYSPLELQDPQKKDKWNDKSVHQNFLTIFKEGE